MIRLNVPDYTVSRHDSENLRPHLCTPVARLLCGALQTPGPSPTRLTSCVLLSPASAPPPPPRVPFEHSIQLILLTRHLG